MQIRTYGEVCGNIFDVDLDVVVAIYTVWH